MDTTSLEHITYFKTTHCALSPECCRITFVHEGTDSPPTALYYVADGRIEWEIAPKANIYWPAPEGRAYLTQADFEQMVQEYVAKNTLFKYPC